MMLHELIEEQVDRTPDATALVGGDTVLTYAELDAWANRVAQTLQQRGVGPEEPVAIYAQRRVETVVAILAVLKAGGAYLPIDPTLPASRFSYVMGDSGARHLVAPADEVDAAPTGDWQVVSLGGATSGEPADRPKSTVTEANAAYILYTSGSTGKPKGVVVPHQQIVASTQRHTIFDRPEPRSFLLLVSFSFDACGIGLYWTLTTGGQVVIPESSQILDAHALRALVQQHQVTHIDCVPSHYSMVLADNAEPLGSLRFISVGGEACPPDLVTRHAALLPHASLNDFYGPTETTVWATCARLRPDDPLGAVSIGRAIPGVRSYVLDGQLRPVASGGTGELYLGGDQVTRGYHRRPALTAQRFLPDPFAEEPGARMYRTGDRVRERADGNLEFVGRVDHQVKVRGYRVELGEVEAALQAHDAVEEAVADVRTIGASPVLVAWVRPRGDDLGTDELTRHLSARLPEYMVPTRIVLVAEMPRMAGVKVDRAALPTPVEQVADGRALTPLEAEIAEIIKTVVGVEHVAAHTNLFDLGATSLHITQLSFTLWQAYGAVQVHDLFQLPTVAGIAQVVAAAQHRQYAEGMEPWDLERLLAEGTLDPTIQGHGLPSADWFAPRAVLLTGATGYLGAFLIRELIHGTDAQVHCLVRARDEEHARERIRAMMTEMRIWDDAYRARITPVLGDLAQPRLGLSDQTYAALSETIDAIYHSGALVNFIYPYEHLKGANVEGTAEILRLAATTRLKAVHHISSIDVLLHTDIPRPFLEDMHLLPVDVPEHGYPRSKWVGDHVARLGRDRAIPVSIYRPGMMIGQTETGATQASDFLLVQIKALLEYGIMPEADFMFDALPIDFVAKAITHISLRREVLGRNFHLWNLQPIHIADVHGWARSFGYEFDMVGLDETVQALVSLDPEHPMYRMLPLMLSDEVGKIPEAVEPDIARSIDMRAECRNTLAALADTDLYPPPMSEDLAHKVFQFFVDTGFLLDPATQRERYRTLRGAAVGQAT